MTDPHHNVELLTAFGLGKADRASWETVSRHLETCIACRHVVAAVPADDFVVRLKEVGGSRTSRPDGAEAGSQCPPPGKEVPPQGGDAAPRNSSRRPISRPGPPGRTAVETSGKTAVETPPIPSRSAAGEAPPPALLASNEYEVLREISRGGMGVVYLVRNRRMDRLEGLKVVHQALLSRKGALERFEREMRAAARLNHPNIVTAYSSPPLEALLAFAMEYCDGIDLQQFVKMSGPLPVPNACYYVFQACQGLQHACERNMVHRDIKPSNLILMREGKKHVVKILDFGLAKATSENQVDAGLTGEGQLLGTPLYMAPEQIVAAARADIRADIYSLGCTLYFLLTGAPPFDRKGNLYEILYAHQTDTARPLNELRADVPGDLAGIVARMMAKEPGQRFEQPADAARALAPFFRQGLKPVPSPAEGRGDASSPVPRDAAADETVSPKETNAELSPIPSAGLAAGGVSPGSVRQETVLEIVGHSTQWIEARRSAARTAGLQRKRAAGWTALALGVSLAAVFILWTAGAFTPARSTDATPNADAESKPPQKRRGGPNSLGKPAPEVPRDGGTEHPVAETLETKPIIADAGPPATNPQAPAPQVPAVASADNEESTETASPPPDVENAEPLITNSIGMKLILIPAGEFEMGYEQTPQELAVLYPYATKDWFAPARRRHRVRITRPFYLGMYEVTVGQFRQFVAERAYETDAEKDRQGSFGYDAATKKIVGPRTEFKWRSTGFPQTDEDPVVYISWNDAQAFCRWLSDREGAHYRLPTEAEWEYACRAGTGTLYQNGDDPQALAETGNAWDVGAEKRFYKAVEPLLPDDGYVFTAPVGQYRANDWGLFDMHGNVWEWCADVFDENYYRLSPADDPPGPARGPARVLRGGAWDKFAASCGSAFRFSRPRHSGGYSTGFRVACTLDGGVARVAP